MNKVKGLHFKIWGGWSQHHQKNIQNDKGHTSVNYNIKTYVWLCLNNFKVNA